MDDDRESPSYRLMEKLERQGAVVSYNDPYIPAIRHTREFPQYADRRTSEVSGDYDLLLVATAHDEFGKLDFLSFGIPVVDARNIVQGNGQMVYRA